MNIGRRIGTLTLAVVLGLPAWAGAVEYKTVLADKSAINFSFKQMNVGMDGHFKKFSTQLSFDPANAANAKVSLDVDLASIDTGTADGNAEVAGKPWFNTSAFPTAKFVSSSVKPLGGNRYEVAGQLTIKGKTQPVVAPTTVTAQGDQATFDGSFTIKRADFAIGEGEWADFSVVANEIQVKFKILASGGK
ncbi:MAG: YceI family protein [Propionivibrio sp.]